MLKAPQPRNAKYSYELTLPLKKYPYLKASLCNERFHTATCIVCLHLKLCHSKYCLISHSLDKLAQRH